jgi:hypothetical protein
VPERQCEANLHPDRLSSLCNESSTVRESDRTADCESHSQFILFAILEGFEDLLGIAHVRSVVFDFYNKSLVKCAAADGDRTSGLSQGKR